MSIYTDWIRDGAVTAEKLDSSVLDNVGVSDESTVRRGFVGIAGAETVSTIFSDFDNTMSYMPTPDRIQNVVLPSNGLICVAYQARWKFSGTNGAAGIFIDDNCLKAAVNSITNNQGTYSSATVNTYATLTSDNNGLISRAPSTPVTTVPTDVTTGQLVGSQDGSGAGGVAYIFADAGTYDVGVRYAAHTSGVVTALLRKLWVWTIGF